MTSRLTVLRPLALAAALVAGGAAQASISVYTDEAAFLAALSGSLVGTDSFDDFVNSSGPVTRDAGSLQYTVDASPRDNLIRTGGEEDGWLTAASKRNTLSFTNFSAGTFAAGAYFFGVTDGEQASKGIVVIDASGADQSAERQLTLTKRAETFFVGFISDAPLTSVTAKYVGGGGALTTVNNLTLAAPVPEPETYALLLSGLAVIGFIARRRREP